MSENGLDIPVATFDVGAEAATRIKDGSLTMAINQQPFLQSYFAVANLANQAKYSLSSGEHRHGHVDRDRGQHRHRAGLHRRGSLLIRLSSDPAAAVPSMDGPRPVG